MFLVAFFQSYGGFYTASVLGSSDIIKVGISVAPVTDWRYYGKNICDISVYKAADSRLSKLRLEPGFTSFPIHFISNSLHLQFTSFTIHFIQKLVSVVRRQPKDFPSPQMPSLSKDEISAVA